MKFAIAFALTAAAFAAMHIPKLKKKNGIILALYAAGMVLFFTVYNIRTIGNILPFYHPTGQSMYQHEFLKNGEYPDAFLNEFLKGKTVYTPDDAYEVSDTDENTMDDGSDFDEDGNYWLYHYYHAVDMWDYLDFNRAKIVKDGSLNGMVLSDDQKARFEDLGAANDMMRYTFPLTPYNGEWGNGFYYYWFYNSFIENSRVYICTENLTDADELVCIWQKVDGAHDTDSYYIASKSYFDEVIAR